jgi:hypothetical protein
VISPTQVRTALAGSSIETKDGTLI